MDIDDLEDRFRHHKPNDSAMGDIAEMRKSALAWAKEIRLLVPEGREQSLALTMIEQTLFWCNAGIARHPDNWAEEE